jgi:hypothetical protein
MACLYKPSQIGPQMVGLIGKSPHYKTLKLDSPQIEISGHRFMMAMDRYYGDFLDI